MNKVIQATRSYIIIAFGLFIIALGWTAFLIPAEITGGGITGVSTIIFYASEFPVGVSYLIISAILVLGALRVLGAGFGIKTVLAVALLSLFLGIMQAIITEPIIDDAFMSAIIGGILAGSGVGIVFTQGSSTGGTDIIAMMVNKYRNISPGRIILYLDLIIISSSYLVFQSIEKIVYGYVTMAVISYSIDMVLSGSKQTFQMFIFSPKYGEIANRIDKEVKRGITLIDAEGWYSKKKSKIVMVLIRRQETSQVIRIVKEIDPDAFISQNNVMGAYGKGFETIRP
ncbi:MAG: YitT family protein [Bacteroidales bacterium]